MMLPSTATHRSGGPSSRHHESSSSLSSTSTRSEMSFINQSIHFASGQFRGRVIRAELHEVQKADLGRKYARVDRRPLDPPPVVLMRLFEVSNPGLGSESAEKEIQDYSTVEVLGFVCTVDLFPVHGTGRSKDHQISHQSHPRLPKDPLPPQSATRHTTQEVKPPEYPEPRVDSCFPSASHSLAHSTSQLRSSPDSSKTGLLPDVLHYVDGHPITEHSKMTSSLVGATFVQPACVDYLGKKSLMFVFADLAVKTEGYFILRYRVFDIFSQPLDHPECVIQAEHYGGVFRVYSTKEFPGLQASTELTKQLARWGVRLNIRETERKRRKKSHSRSQSPLSPVASPSTSATISKSTATGSSVNINEGREVKSTYPLKRPRLSPPQSSQQGADSSRSHTGN